MMKNTKGITLVALVVTIIILLILAGVAITALMQTNLFKQAEQAKNATENAQKEENVILGSYEDKIDEIIGSREQITVDKDEYEQLLKDVENLKTRNANNNYSTEERIVGSWIDGKTIYQKVFELNANKSRKPDCKYKRS